MSASFFAPGVLKEFRAFTPFEYRDHLTAAILVQTLTQGTDKMSSKLISVLKTPAGHKRVQSSGVHIH